MFNVVYYKTPYKEWLVLKNMFIKSRKWIECDFKVLIMYDNYRHLNKL